MTFFKGSDGIGGTTEFDPSFFIGGFGNAAFSVASDRFIIRNFSFDAVNDARFDSVAVPEPPSLLLLAPSATALRRRHLGVLRRCWSA